MTAIEKGERRIQPEELVRLAKLYGCKLSRLLRSDQPVEDVSTQLRSALPPEAPGDADLLPHIQELEGLCDDYPEVERLAGVSLSRREPPSYPIGGVDPEEAAEDVATAERNRLGLGDAPILNLRAVLEEDAGLRIFFLDLPSKVAAMFAFTDEHGGTIAVNRNHPAERRRHSMAHEYGHFLTEPYRSEITFFGRYERRPATERFAESFGRALLMPAGSLRRRFHELARARKREGQGPTAGDVCHLAHFFFVSFEAMARRLEELALLPAGTWDRLRLQGFRVGEAQRLLGLQERPVDDGLLPARYRHLAVEAWQRERISEGQLASLLRVDRLTARRVEIGGALLQLARTARSTELWPVRTIAGTMGRKAVNRGRRSKGGDRQQALSCRRPLPRTAGPATPTTAACNPSTSAPRRTGTPPRDPPVLPLRHLARVSEKTAQLQPLQTVAAVSHGPYTDSGSHMRRKHMRTLCQKAAPLSLGFLLLLPGALTAGLVPPPDIAGLWSVSTDCALPRQNLPCVFEGSGQVTQSGDQVMGTVQLMLVSGPAACPTEMLADLQGTLVGSSFMGTLDGGAMFGALDFSGTVSVDGQTITGDFAVQDGGPFQGCSGAFDAERQIVDVAIPTLSGMSLVILWVLLLGAGLVMLRRRASAV